jgi:hypothetical protein
MCYSHWQMAEYKEVLITYLDILGFRELVENIIGHQTKFSTCSS